MPTSMTKAVKASQLCLAIAEETADKALELQTDLAGLSVMFLARASQALYSATLLAQHGMIGDAMSVTRTIVELDVDYAYITTSPDTLIKKFAEYDHIAKFRLAKAIDKLHDGTVSRDAMRVLEERHDEARTNNPESRLNWAGKSLKERTELADAHPGRETLVEGKPVAARTRNYELLYADMCTASHSCYGTLEYALVGRDDEPRVHFGPMEPDTKPIMLAFAVLLLLCETVAEECQLAGLEERFSSLRTMLTSA